MVRLIIVWTPFFTFSLLLAYCDVYLTHDAPRVRKDHNAGWKHAAQVRAHFLSQNQDRMTRIVGEIVKDYEERGAPVFIPAPITIGRPPVGGGVPGSRPPMGNYVPPPPPPHLAQAFRPLPPSNDNISGIGPLLIFF